MQVIIRNEPACGCGHDLFRIGKVQDEDTLLALCENCATIYHLTEQRRLELINLLIALHTLIDIP